MSPAETIEHTRVPKTRSVFFLGCFEKRVTVYSQQVRAINLVAAILDQKLVRENGKVAIVGGGAAGLTAAVAFAKAAPQLQAIHVYEKRAEVLQLQQSSNRYLHPHNYDWPAEMAAETSAGLPFLNWRAGVARDVQRHLRQQFDNAARGSAINLRVVYKAEHLATRAELRPSAVRTERDGSTEVLDINPNLYFSEGELSALSVSALLAASTSFRWSRWRGLLLDDPLQHNDVIHASAFMDVMRQLVRRLHYQVIMSTHDSAEAAFLVRKCESAGIPLRVHELRPPGYNGLVSNAA